MEPHPDTLAASTSPIPRRTTRFVIGACAVLAAMIAGGTIADASTLGGLTSAVLSAITTPASTGAPTVTAWENFNGPNGTNLDGTTTDGGGRTWNAIRGTWRIQGNQADTSVGDVALVVNAGSPNQAVEATVFRGGTTFDIGLVANMNAAGNQFITIELTSNSNGQLEMWRYNGGWTLLASVPGLYSGAPATWPTSATLRFESTASGGLRVLLNGVVQINYTLSPADQTVFKNASHQLFGLYSYFDGASLWDDFHIDA